MNNSWLLNNKPKWWNVAVSGVAIVLIGGASLLLIHHYYNDNKRSSTRTRSSVKHVRVDGINMIDEKTGQSQDMNLNSKYVDSIRGDDTADHDQSASDSANSDDSRLFEAFLNGKETFETQQRRYWANAPRSKGRSRFNEPFVVRDYEDKIKARLCDLNNYFGRTKPLNVDKFNELVVHGMVYRMRQYSKSKDHKFLIYVHGWTSNKSKDMKRLADLDNCFDPQQNNQVLCAVFSWPSQNGHHQ